MLAKLTTWPLRSCVFELYLSCSHSLPVRILFRSRRAGGCFLSYFSCHSSQTLSVLNKCTVTQVPSRLVTCAECRHTAARFVCPTIPNIKSNVGRNGNHHIIAFCNFRWPLLCSLFWFAFPDSNISLQELLPGYYALYGSRRKNSRDK